MKEETKEMLEIAAWKGKYNEVVGEKNSLVRSISSYKGENTKLRKRNKELVAINDALCKKNIELRRNVGEWKSKYDCMEQNNEILSKKLDNFLALPWYKKIFV